MERNNYRYGKIGLAALLFGLPLAVWFGGWRKPVALWRSYRQNEAVLRELRQCRETSGDTLAVRLKKEALLRDGRLLERVRQWGEGRGVTVLGYTPWLSGEERGWKLYTAEFTLAGGFLPMLEVLAALEREGEALRPVAARFRLHTDVRRREKQLQLTLWIQQITEE